MSFMHSGAGGQETSTVDIILLINHMLMETDRQPTMAEIFNNQPNNIYRQTCNISHTKSENLDISRLVLQLVLPNPLKSGVKSRMKM